MKLKDLLAGIRTAQPFSEADAEREVSGVAYKSTNVAPGAAFFAIRGEATDGNLYVFDAIERGATVIVSELTRPNGGAVNDEWQKILARATTAPEKRIIPKIVAWIQVPEARKALSLASANIFKHPAASLKFVGITGTSGKTTTSFLVDSIFHAAGLTAGLFGTVVYRTPRAEVHATNTTPESYEMQRFFSELRDSGGSAAVMEVSSHALSMDRLWGCHFDVAVFTNFTSDHLDYHKDHRRLFLPRSARLFEGTGAGSRESRVINTGRPARERFSGAGRTRDYFRADQWRESDNAQFRAFIFRIAIHGADSERKY